MADQPEVVIVGAARTPTGKFLGALAGATAPRLASVAMRAAIERSGVAPDDVDECFVGNVVSAGIGQAPARQAALAAGLPVRVPATTINLVCGSGLKAIIAASQAIRAGDGTTFVAAGTESMSNAPYLLPGARVGLRAGPAELVDANLKDGLWCATEDQAMGAFAEATASQFDLTRAALDEYALRSHQKAIAATRAGWFADEIVKVEIGRERGPVTHLGEDEPPRAECSLEALGRLKPAFRPNGIVTAGNAPGLSDGAAAVVVMEHRAAAASGRSMMARILGYAGVAVEPRDLFTAPPLAIQAAVARAGLSLAEVELFELNEAFAAQVLANAKVLGWDRDYLDERVNVNGGAIALGHPIGASGARIVVTLIHALRRRGARYGAAALCHGGGGAVAVVVEARS
jgi:acetyl-CoA C-acetyltransferase